MQKKNGFSLLLFSLLTLLLVSASVTEVKAQLEIGGGFLIRTMKPGTGYGIVGELGVPSDSDWRISFRAAIGIFGAALPDYREVQNINWTRGDTTYVKPYDGLKMSSFDRSVGFRIYYQVTEFQPFFGVGATYAYNDIEEFPNVTNQDNMDRSLNFDFHFGASYMMSDHWNFILDMQMTNITRADYILNESFFGVNFILSYRFGTNRFSNVYQ